MRQGRLLKMREILQRCWTPLEQLHALISTSGIATYASGNTANIAFGSNAEGDILYHNGTSFVRLAKGSDDYVLKMNGNVPNWEESTAGDVTTAQLNYVSGIAVYSSGQAIANESDIVAVSGIAHYASGQSESLNNVSGVATSLISSYWYEPHMLRVIPLTNSYSN